MVGRLVDMNRIGIDLDNIKVEQAMQLKQLILKEEKLNGLTQILVFQTKHGYHLELIYNRKISIKENFMIRAKYGDCEYRRKYSKERLNLLDGGYDILFSVKDNYWRRRVW